MLKGTMKITLFFSSIHPWTNNFPCVRGLSSFSLSLVENRARGSSICSPKVEQTNIHHLFISSDFSFPSSFLFLLFLFLLTYNIHNLYKLIYLHSCSTLPYLSFSTYIKKGTKHPWSSPSSFTMSEHQYKFNVSMSCGGCSGAIERVLKKLEGIFLFLSFPHPFSLFFPVLALNFVCGVLHTLCILYHLGYFSPPKLLFIYIYYPSLIYLLLMIWSRR